MKRYKKNTRDMWIDGLQEKSEVILKHLTHKQNLNIREQELQDLCAGFIYLHGICEEREILDEPDTELFENVTIH
tara:strand:- start:12 stop:236 length:225 start_codon:yes stop_codon:yes gene_type:complete